ncbi:proteasome endopeptidase complex, beta subunit [Pyrolobus fumarii 1A]|uniref:Proteasome subunit beta n=2 Tax=Pyrolobus fumarii TaxID=54252 RepID=G0EEX2_PYRF1|nr:proteasome endopeptidase complex, beta subunit [Pyrolobus fumarii 1A]
MVKLLAPSRMQRGLLETGTTTVGLKLREYVVLAADRRATAGYYIAHKKTRKIVKITDYMAMTTSGLVADAQVLAEILREELRYYELTTKRKPSVAAAANMLAAIIFSARMYPYIVQLLLGGYDTAPRLFNIDWLGTVTEEKYTATGSGSPIAIGVIESGYREDMKVDEAVELAVKAVRAAMERDVATGNGIDVVIIGKGTFITREYPPR